MNNRNRTNGTDAIKRRLAQGRGKGRGADYKPYLTVHDFASRGQKSRIRSPLNGRVHHVFSQLEANWLHAFYSIPGLIDVREQYPLDLEETIQIAAELGIIHPTDPRTREACVVTTDFLLTRLDGLREFDTAVAIKPSADLASSRTLEKLEIERVHWSARNIIWRILTEQELPRALVKNMKWIQPHLDLAESDEFPPEQIARIRIAMEPAVEQGEYSLVEVATACDNRLGLKPGAALCVVRHLIGTGAWPVDLTVEIDLQKPLQLISKQIKYDIAA